MFQKVKPNAHLKIYFNKGLRRNLRVRQPKMGFHHTARVYIIPGASWIQTKFPLDQPREGIHTVRKSTSSAPPSLRQDPPLDRPLRGRSTEGEFRAKGRLFTKQFNSNSQKMCIWFYFLESTQSPSIQCAEVMTKIQCRIICCRLCNGS